MIRGRWFTQVHPVGHWVHPRTLGSLGCTLWVIEFIRRRSLGVHSVSPWRSLGSSWVIGLTRVRPRGRWVLPGSLNSLEFALGVAWFIRCLWVALGFDGFIRSLWVHWRSPWGSLGSQGFALWVVGFNRCRWLHSGSFGSLGCAPVVVGFIRGIWFHSCSPL